MFSAGLNFCARPKTYLYIVTVTNILCQTKRWFAFSKISFCASTKGLEEALNAVKFLGWFKTFGLTQKILRPVKDKALDYKLYIKRLKLEFFCKNYLS